MDWLFVCMKSFSGSIVAISSGQFNGKSVRNQGECPKIMFVTNQG
jgi:hypothetical protein